MPTTVKHNAWPLRPGEVFGAQLFPNKFDRLSKTKSKQFKNNKRKFPIKRM
ncbi:MAG: hypothetical protein WC264_00475 [Candidatus Paceibacterota bacterium]|jgi:hypothetical protein